MRIQVQDSANWRRISHEFGKIWNVPNCIGAIDGKHVAIQCPTGAGSEYYNYKKVQSVVLMAVADASYIFTMIDIGAYGSESDRCLFNTSQIGHALANGSLGIPPCSKLPYSDIILPKFIVGDEAFPLKPYLMKPYAGRNTGLLPPDQVIYNYRNN